MQYRLADDETDGRTLGELTEEQYEALLTANMVWGCRSCSGSTVKVAHTTRPLSEIEAFLTPPVDEDFNT